MTKFITYHNLFPIPDPKEFLGTSKDRDDGLIITTLGKNIVIVLDIRTHKQVRSWSVVEKLSSKVIYDRATENYVGVFGQHVLRCWNVTTVDINKCKKLKFFKNITQLINDVSGNAWVLYNDGTLEPLTLALQTRKERDEAVEDNELAPPYTISEPKIIESTEDRQLLCYYKRYHKNDEFILVCQMLSAEGVCGEAIEYKINRGSPDVSIVGSVVVENLKVPSLFTVWSDKRIFMLNLTGIVSEDNSPGSYVSMLNEVDVRQPLSIHCISRDFVVIYGANSGQEGGMLLLYNTRFKVVKAKQFFKIYFNISQLWSQEDHILLAVGRNLAVVTYRMSQELLSELIGTKCSNNFRTPIEEEHINEEETLEENIVFAGDLPKNKPQKVKNNATKKKPANITIADGKTVPYEPIDLFDMKLNILSQRLMHVDVVQVTTDSAQDGLQFDVMTNYNDTGCTHLHIQQIIRQIERCGASEHEVSEKLLTVFVRAQRTEDIIMCLRRYTNISEKVLAKTLRYALNNYRKSATKINSETDAKMVSKIQAKLNEQEIPFKETELPNLDILENAQRKNPPKDLPLFAQLLNAVLVCPFESTLMTIHTRRQITYKQVLILLEYLYELINSPDINTFAARPSFSPSCVEFELQVFRWFGVLLNSHFQQLVMSKDLELVEILFKWNELFLLYKEEVSHLQETAAILYNIVENRKLAENNYSKWYSIEEIQLYKSEE